MLRLALELNVQLWDDPQHEKDPLVHLWLSQDVSQQLVERALKQQSQEQTLTIEEDFVVQKHPSLLPAVDRIQTACINMDFWCHLRNKHGASCLNQIGSVCVPLCDLMAQQPADKPLELDIQIPSFGDPSGQRKDDSVINYKGHLKLRLISLVLDGVPVPPASTKLLQMMGQVQRYKQTVYQHYIGSCVAMFRKFQPSWPVVKDINAYVYQARTGQLPALGYLAIRTGGTPACYFENAARIVLRRAGLSLDRFQWQTDSRGPAMLGRVLTLAANIMTYVPCLLFKMFLTPCRQVCAR